MKKIRIEGELYNELLVVKRDMSFSKYLEKLINEFEIRKFSFVS